MEKLKGLIVGISLFSALFAYVLINDKKRKLKELFIPTFIGLTLSMVIVPSYFGYENTQIGSFYEGVYYNECYYVIVYNEYSNQKEIMSAQIYRDEEGYDIQYLYHPENGTISFLDDYEYINVEYPESVTDDYHRDFNIKLTDKKAERPKHYEAKPNCSETKNYYYIIFGYVFGVYLIYAYIRLIAIFIQKHLPTKLDTSFLSFSERKLNKVAEQLATSQMTTKEILLFIIQKIKNGDLWGTRTKIKPAYLGIASNYLKSNGFEERLKVCRYMFESNNIIDEEDIAEVIVLSEAAIKNNDIEHATELIVQIPAKSIKHGELAYTLTILKKISAFAIVCFIEKIAKRLQENIYDICVDYPFKKSIKLELPQELIKKYEDVYCMECKEKMDEHLESDKILHQILSIIIKQTNYYKN